MKTNVILAIDCSGSMADHVEGLRASVRTMVGDFRKSKKDLLLSVILFGVGAFGIKRLFTQTPVKDVDLQSLLSQITADGGTPLYETGTLACQIASAIAQVEPGGRVISTILTDGQATDHANRTAFMARLRTTLQADNITFTAMVPDSGSRQSLIGMGFSADNVITWDTTKDFSEDHEASKVLRTSYNSYVNSSDRKSTGFFAVNLTDTKIDKVKTKLKDLRKNFRTLKVDHEQPIKEFVEDKGLQYVRGSAFYELTKAETVQPYKQLLLQERGRKRIYGGEDARKVLGFPKGNTVKVTPGNHQNFKIFIQSTSTNRKLVRGTELLFSLQP